MYCLLSLKSRAGLLFVDSIKSKICLKILYNFSFFEMKKKIENYENKQFHLAIEQGTSRTFIADIHFC